MPAPTGTIVAYATAPGSTADDGSGSHGVYTSALARQLVIPGLDIKEVFDRAAQEVERVTGGRQKPREEIGLRGRFVLQEVPPADAAITPPAAVSAGQEPLLFDDQEAVFADPPASLTRHRRLVPRS
jgi:uncharacterized caspase-like protein